jgi:hypothetical protein
MSRSILNNASEKTLMLETVATKLHSINPLVDEVFKQVEAWLEANGRSHYEAWGVILQHANRTRVHSAAMAQRIHELAGPPAPVAPNVEGIGNPPEVHVIAETDLAYDEDQLDRLTSSDLRDAIQFDSEFKDTFGLSRVDEEIRMPLNDAMELLLTMLENGTATVPGMMVKATKVILKGCPRAFGSYYAGKDLWPRDSAVVQAEIDYRMPEALNWLRVELKDALGCEAQARSMTAKAAGGTDGE